MKIRNWEKYQHYKHRNPPWIRLYKAILDDMEIALLDDKTFRVLVSLLLLASEDEAMEGNLPPVDKIAWRLRMDVNELVKCIQQLKPFVLQPASIVLASCLRDANTEKSREEKDFMPVDNVDKWITSDFNPEEKPKTRLLKG